MSDDCSQHSESQNSQRGNSRHSKFKSLIFDYHRKVSNEDTQYKQTMSALKSKISEDLQSQFTKQYEVFAQNFWETHHKNKVHHATMQYYMENWEKHEHNPKENNLFPLFNEIDERIQKNLQKIQAFKFTAKWPENQQKVEEDLQNAKCLLLEAQLKAMKSYLSQSENFKKYCSNDIKQLRQIHVNYAETFGQIKKGKIIESQVEFTGAMDETLSYIRLFKHPQKVKLSIRSPKGFLEMSEISELMGELKSKKQLLKSLELRFMDMQFTQQKCNSLKEGLKQMKLLKHVRIQNYYRQCKLGRFEDFNWLPLKKETHIFGAVW